MHSRFEPTHIHIHTHTDIHTGSHTGSSASRRMRRKLRHARRRERGRHMHDHHERFGHHAPHSRGGGRHRARRGAIVEAVLTLLDERPMHGYELITELEERSDGRWRPSAGTMYPALSRMEARGLLVSEEIDDKKQFSLNDAGRERLAAVRAERSDDAPEPWNEHAGSGRGDLRRRIHEIVGQARQIGRFGTAQQITAAGEVLDHTRRRLYEILAGIDTPDTADSDAGTGTGTDTSSNDTSTTDTSTTDTSTTDTSTTD